LRRQHVLGEAMGEPVAVGGRLDPFRHGGGLSQDIVVTDGIFVHGKNIRNYSAALA